MTDKAPVAVAIGAGPGIGAGFVRRFAKGGYTVVIGRRNLDKAANLIAEVEAAGGRAVAMTIDARSEDSVSDRFAEIERNIGPIEVALYNAGANTNKPILEMQSDLFEKVWRLSCFGGFLMGREAARHMVPRGKGTILYTGATASMRGGPGFSAFASAKFGLRAVAQSLARELGPKGIHVAHVIVDGGVDSEVIRERRSNAGLDNIDGTLIDTYQIAEAYWMLHNQPASAWTHEIDIRTSVEKW
ncbi:MAG: SDR family NAD(P)-dependent oxidoreductase [Pseudomonadota bacterium]